MQKINEEDVFMTKEELYAPIREKYDELKQALKGTDLEKIRELR